MALGATHKTHIKRARFFVKKAAAAASRATRAAKKGNCGAAIAFLSQASFAAGAAFEDVRGSMKGHRRVAATKAMAKKSRRLKGADRVAATVRKYCAR